MTHNRDRTIENAWRLFLGTVIFAAACVAVMLLYSAFFEALGQRWVASSTYCVMAAALAAGVTWLCQHREELIGIQ
jgi:hypothetical protein